MTQPKIDWTKPVRTRLAKRRVIVFTTKAKGGAPVVGQLEGFNDICFWYLDGKAALNIFEAFDLENVPEKITGWINIYPTKNTSDIHETKEIADKCAQDSRIACIKIEFEEGEGL